MFSMPCFSVALEDGQPEQEPCMCRRTTPCAVTAKHDVAAITGHRGTNTGVDQFLDLIDDLAIGLVHVFLVEVRCVTLDHRTAGDEMVHDDAQDLGLQRLPGNLVVLGHGDEIAAQEDARDAGQGEQIGCQRAATRLRGRRSRRWKAPSPRVRAGT